MCHVTVTTRTKKYEKPPQRKQDKMNINFMTCMTIDCVHLVVTQNQFISQTLCYNFFASKTGKEMYIFVTDLISKLFRVWKGSFQAICL